MTPLCIGLLFNVLAAATAPAQGESPHAAQSFLDEAPSATAERPRSAAQAIGITCVMLAMAAGGGLMFVRAQNKANPQVPGDKITLLAFKPLGGRQRLALVEVCGERLLLAANEREVTLLSHLPGATDGLEQAASEVALAQSVVMPKGQTVAAMEQALAQQTQPEAANNLDASTAAPMPAAPLHADLAGLQRWQQQAHMERGA